jgi:uncharacterized protein
MRSALVVRGGWEGHAPVAATEIFIPDLRRQGFDVMTSSSLDVYADLAVVMRQDLIVQCWSMDDISPAQSAGLREAVASGVGFAGWHGGVVATFANDPAYLRMVGGQFLFHHPEFVDYDVSVVASHPIVDGIERFSVHSEQYWVLTDSHNDVLAETVFSPYPGGGFAEPVTMPVIWTRRWGLGNIFVSTIGHRVEDLLAPEVREVTLRGLTWAAR